MAQVASACFGLNAYAIFLGAFLYLIGFVSGVIVPKSTETGPTVPTIHAVVINLLHPNLIARRRFKERWTKLIPGTIEPSVYVLLAWLTLVLLIWQ